MISISCIAIDDEPPALRQMEEYISKVPFLNLVRTLTNPLELLEFLKENHIDLIFLDIQMDNLSGIELIKILEQKPMIILTTAYDSYALNAFDLDVDDYLLKPISFERFLKATEKIYNRYLQHAKTDPSSLTEKPVDSKYFFVKTDFQIKRINFEDILYIKGLKEYLIIYTIDDRTFTLQTFKEILSQLPEKWFVRVHKSYIVPLSKIDSIRKRSIMIGDTQIPIGNTYKEAFLAAIKNPHN